MFNENTRFRGRIFHSDSKMIKSLEWRDTIREVKIDLGMPVEPKVEETLEVKKLRSEGGLTYIENERGFVSLPYLN